MSLCESEQAIASVQERNRDLLKALAREQAQLYTEVGQAFASRREALAERARCRKPAKTRSAAKPKRSNAPEKDVEHA